MSAREVSVPQDEIRVEVELSKQVPRVVTKQVPRVVTKQVQTPYTALVPDYLNESGWNYVQGAGYHTYQKDYRNDNSTPNSNYDVWIARHNVDTNLVTGVVIMTGDYHYDWETNDEGYSYKVRNGYEINSNLVFRVFIRASRVTTGTFYNTTTVQETVYDTVQETVYDTVTNVRILKYIDLESVMVSEGWTSYEILNTYLTYADLRQIGIYI